MSLELLPLFAIDSSLPKYANEKVSADFTFMRIRDRDGDGFPNHELMFASSIRALKA